jgi:hypothetical protein
VYLVETPCVLDSDTHIQIIMPFSAPGEKITFTISGLIGLKGTERGESIDTLAGTKAESGLILPLLFISFGNHQLPDGLAFEDK